MGIHDGHRERLKEQYIGSGIGSFNPHQVLELLLGYSIPRKDTNELAHTLMSMYGSLDGVLHASAESLETVKGVTAHTAILLNLIGDVSDGYVAKNDKKVRFDSVDAAGEYLLRFLSYAAEEQVFLMCLGKNMMLKYCAPIYFGDINSVRFRIRDVTETAIKCESESVILAHNHPDGSCYPSSSDIDSTLRIRDSLSTNAIELTEHFVIGSHRCVPILANLENRR